MNKGVWFIFGLIIGAASGSAISYYISNKKFNDRFNSEVDAVKCSYNDIVEKYKKRLGEAEAELEKGTSSTDVVERVLRPLEGSTSDDSNLRHNYTKYSKNCVKTDPRAFEDKSSIKEPEPRDEVESLHPMDSDEDEEPEDEVVTEEEQRFITGLEMSNNHETKRKDKPKLIRQEDYGNDGTLQQATLYYYTGDDVLIDTEDGSEVVDQYRYVGDCLDKFGFRTNDQESICVRNDSLGFDFQIEKIIGYHSAPDYI